MSDTERFDAVYADSRDRTLDPEVRATLDALAKLSVPARKTLLLSHLTSASHHELAREVGLSIEDAETLLQDATTEFVSQRSVPADEVRPVLDRLVGHC